MHLFFNSSRFNSSRFKSSRFTAIRGRDRRVSGSAMRAAVRMVALAAAVIGLTAAMTASPDSARAADTRVPGASSASRANPEARHTRSHNPRQPAPAPDAFNVFYAVRMGSSFLVAGANGATVPCGDGSVATACFASSIDLAKVGISASSAAAVLREVGSSPRAVKLLFVGSMQGDSLQVWQAWRAPEAVSTAATIYSVSHPNEQALSVNDWTAASLGTLDFASAPLAATCDIVPGTSCTPTLDAPTVQVHTPAGILISGSVHRGSFRVESYFLDMSFGVTQSGDGYSYCKEGQFICYNFVCGDVPNDCNTTHGRIRGLLDPPTLPSDPAFMRWQLATGQLMAQEVYGP